MTETDPEYHPDLPAWLPYAAAGEVREAQARFEAKRHQADATTNRERAGLLEKRLSVIELALARCIGPTGLQALKDTHPTLWPDDRPRQETLSA